MDWKRLSKAHEKLWSHRRCGGVPPFFQDFLHRLHLDLIKMTGESLRKAYRPRRGNNGHRGISTPSPCIFYVKKSIIYEVKNSQHSHPEGNGKNLLQPEKGKENKALYPWEKIRNKCWTTHISTVKVSSCDQQTQHLL